MKPNIYPKTHTLEEAIALWKKRLDAIKMLAPLGPETVRVVESLGRITARPVTARISSPFYHASAMDGYAVRFTETFGASEESPRLLAIGTEALYLDTGDPVPEDMNAVIMIEDINVVGDKIEITAAATPWQHVRVVGEDIVATELIAPENQRIRPVDMAAMLAGGLTEVEVRRRPRIAIIPTGDEIVEPGSALKPGDIIEYNSRMLEAMVLELGAEPVRMPITKDDPELLKRALTDACAADDMAVLIAGASTGTGDFSEHVIGAVGELVLHGLAIKPGKPGMLGIVNGKPVIGTPGYPVACNLVFTLFARPLIRGWLGLDPEDSDRCRAILSRQVASGLGQREFLRVKLGEVGGKLIATPLGRGAGLVMTLVRADGVLEVPEMSEGIASGTEVDVRLMRPLREVRDTIVIIGSHDNALDVLANALRKRHPGMSLSSAHVGSMGGLNALRRGEAHMATSHLLDEETGEYNVTYLKRMLPDMELTLINLVHRTQGFMVRRGNPKGIREFKDLSRPDVLFINRQRGAGTRLLLDQALKRLGITPEMVRGYEREEYTHMAVASSVLTGIADAGLGVLSAASALGLDFVPVAEERYDLVIPTEHLETERVSLLLDIIRTDSEFRAAVEALGGYDTKDMGKVLWSN